MDSVRRYFPAVIQRIDRLIRVDECLRVRRSVASLKGSKEESDEAGK
jgi:hypothetical protein